MAAINEGERIKGTNFDVIYLVIDRALRPIASSDVYEALFGDKDYKFRQVPQDTVERAPKGARLTRTIALIKGADNFTYLIDDGKKRRLASTDVFNRYNFSTKKLVNVGDLIDLIASGPNIE